MARTPGGHAVLCDPRLNHGTAFTNEERDALGIRGLLPPRVLSIENQEKRILENLARKESDLERYILLMSLRDRNETLFFRVLMHHLDALMPIVYTPTVGEACQHYGHILRRSQGLYLSIEDLGSVDEVLSNWIVPDVRVIVVTDGERILGLGDLGADGMGIPIGKLALYTACAGIDPSYCLPVMIDVGTENERNLKDPLYIGLQQRRERGEAYDQLVDEFMEAASRRFPGVLIQLEDFANRNAFRLLERYRDHYCVFDDDIQGTAAVTLAGVLSALEVSGERLVDQRFLFLGAGEAGIGIGELLVGALTQAGLPEADARQRCWFMDSTGLVVDSRTDLNAHKRHFAHDIPFIKDVTEAAQTLDATAVIGVSGTPGIITERLVRDLTARHARPIVFALSNPTSQSECTAEEAYRWSDGQALFASGSPFAAVAYENQTFVPGQANNAYIFPGVGLGILASKASRVTDEMFFAAARVLVEETSDDDRALGRLFPSLKRVGEVSASIAVAVAEVAFEAGLAGIARPQDLGTHVREMMYTPEYVS